MKNLELNQMEKIEGGDGVDCAVSAGLALIGIVILSAATAAAPVMSIWTLGSILTISAGVTYTCGNALNNMQV
jgi:hypothetical protein